MKPELVYLKPYLWKEVDGKRVRQFADRSAPMRLALTELKGFQLNLESWMEYALLRADGSVDTYMRGCYEP